MNNHEALPQKPAFDFDQMTNCKLKRVRNYITTLFKSLKRYKT